MNDSERIGAMTNALAALGEGAQPYDVAMAIYEGLIPIVTRANPYYVAVRQAKAELLEAMSEERGILLARIEAQEATNADLLRALQGQKPALDVAALTAAWRVCNADAAPERSGRYSDLRAAIHNLRIALEKLKGEKE